MDFELDVQAMTCDSLVTVYLHLYDMIILRFDFFINHFTNYIFLYPT